jgi:hypothetical protein
MADDAVEVFPDAEPLQAAYQPFDVHLYETLVSRATDGSVIRLSDGGLHASPTRQSSLELPEGAAPFMFVSPEQLTRMARDLRRTGRVGS